MCFALIHSGQLQFLSRNQRLGHAAHYWKYFQRTWKIIPSEEPLDYNTFVIKDNFRYSRTIPHFQSTYTFSPVPYVSTKSDNNNHITGVFLLKLCSILFCEYFTHEKIYFNMLPTNKNLDGRQLLWGMVVDTFALIGQCFMECPLVTRICSCYIHSNYLNGQLGLLHFIYLRVHSCLSLRALLRLSGAWISCVVSHMSREECSKFLLFLPQYPCTGKLQMIGLQKHKSHNPLLHVFMRLRKQIDCLTKSFSK